MSSSAAVFEFTLAEILAFLSACGAAIGAMGRIWWTALKRDQGQEVRIKALESWRKRAEPRLKRLRDIELVRSSGGDVPAHTTHTTSGPGDSML